MESVNQSDGNGKTNGSTRGRAAKPEYLRWHELKPILDALSLEWRPLFAIAIQNGIRKGELLALRMSDIEWPRECGKGLP